MKRFQYNLENVLNYKNQVLNNLKTQHAAAADRVNRKQQQLYGMEGTLNQFQRDFNVTMKQGVSGETVRLYSICIDGARKQIEEEKEQLSILKREERKKSQEVLTAKVDTSRYEKLRDRRLREYSKAVQKEEELFAEEFIIRSMAGGTGKGVFI